MASTGIPLDPPRRAIERLLNLMFALGVAAFFWAFVAGFVYLFSIDGALPLNTDHLRGARQRAARGDAAGAVRQYQIATLIEPTDVRALHETGELLARAGRYQEALAAFEGVLRVRPDGRALASIGDVLVAQRRYAEAPEYYERSLEVAPKQAGVLNGLGTARALQGNLDGAIAAFDAALAIDPDSPARANLARALDEKQRLATVAKAPR